MRLIPYGRQDINQDDVDAVASVLTSDWLTQGPMLGKFEAAMAAHCDVPYAFAVNSGTSALHLACLALGVGPGDTVWTSPNTFVASANCALYCGAGIDFVDIDLATGNLSTDRLEEKLQQAAREGTLPKVVIPVHFAGQSCDMLAVRRLADAYGFAVIEDASHAVGGRYQGVPVGSCTYSDITVFSFHPVKVLTTAEGGMALTRSPQLASTLERLRSHGITRDPALLQSEADGPWYYEQHDLGFNYRMTDLQAALGLSQLTRLDSFVQRRLEIAEQYASRLAGLPLEPLAVSPGVNSSWHLYVVRVEARQRRSFFDALRAQGLGVQVHYIPVHVQPYYRERGFRPGQYPAAEEHYARSLSLPTFPAMDGAELNEVLRRIERAVDEVFV